MVARNGVTRSERALTVPGSSEVVGEKGEKLSRQATHRQQTSHHFHLNRQVTKESAQQLGADIAAHLLKPVRSLAGSTAPSRTVSRRPSGDGLAVPEVIESLSSKAHNKRVGLTADDLQLRKLAQQDLSRQLAKEHQELVDTVLADSREVDQSILRMRDGLSNAARELASLRATLKSAGEVMAKLTASTVPSEVSDHEAHLSRLRHNYSTIENGTIKALEKRLRDSDKRVQVLKDRMEKVHSDVTRSEMRDAKEMKQSRKRHTYFWLSICGITAMIWLAFVSYPPRNVLKAMTSTAPLHSGIDISPEDIFGDLGDMRWDRLASLAEQRSEDDGRLRFLDEL